MAPAIKPEWFPDWRGQSAVIIAGGASATASCITQARLAGLRVMVVNNAWSLAPWADALFAGDAAWWRFYGPALEFDGLRITTRAGRGFGTVAVKVDIGERRFILDRQGIIGDGRNSGFYALNLVAQFGARKIALVGFDFSGIHWHGEHVADLENPTAMKFRLWRRLLEDSAAALFAGGIDVVNCSPVSALRCFRQMSLSEFVRSENTDFAPSAGRHLDRKNRQGLAARGGRTVTI